MHAPTAPPNGGTAPARTPDSRTFGGSTGAFAATVYGKTVLHAIRIEEKRRLATLARPAAITPDVVTATPFTVNTTNDTDLANLSGTTCVDSDNNCSLRAAIEAANNLGTPVTITLPAGTYQLTQVKALAVSDPGGVSIVGASSDTTSVEGDGSGVFSVDAASSSTSGALLYLTDLTVTGGSTAEGGGIYLGDVGGIPPSGPGSTAVLDHVVVTNNTASSYGGGIFAADYDTLYMTDSTISDNSAPDGGGIYSYGLNAEFVDSTITTNTASSSYGAGIYDEYSVFEINGGSIDHNTGPSDGGGIYSYYDDISLDGVSVDNNASSSEGGAVYGYWDEVDVTGGTMSDNASEYGGGVYVEEAGQVAVHGTTLDGDTSSSDGGAFYLYGDGYAAQLIVDSQSTISNATGSAIYEYGYYGDADVSISNSTLTDNADTYDNGYDSYGCGGAVCGYEEYGNINLELNGDTVSDNSYTGSADYGSGAITLWNYYGGGASVELTDNTFTGNSSGSDGYGGAVGIYNDECVGGSLNASGNTFSTNSVGSDGLGGAISVYNEEYAGSLVALNDNTFTSNSVGASGYGGAVSFYNDEYSGLSGVLNGNTFTSNSIASSGYGGAVMAYNYYEGGLNLESTGDTFTSNAAGSSGYGGAIMTYSDDDDSPVSLRTNSDTFDTNTAGTADNSGFGGAVGIYYYTTFADSGSTFSGNQALGSSGYGGAIYDASYETARYTGTTFSGNSSGYYGGAVYTDDEYGGDVFDRATLAGNTAGEAGGGVYADSGVYTLEFKRSTISGNTAGVANTTYGEGGGIFSDNALLVLENSTVSGNTALKDSGSGGFGGGIYAASGENGTNLGLRSSTVSGNVADNGGGLYEQGFTGTMLASIVSGNFASDGTTEQDCMDDSAKSTLVSVGYNLVGGAACVSVLQPTDIVSTSPGLNALANNGGPTKTMSLKANSPALDAGPTKGIGCPATDQRGILRPQGAACDIGAYEAAPPTVTTDPATAILVKTAMLHGHVTANGRPTTYHFQYGLTASYGSTTATANGGSGNSAVAVSAGLSGLAPNTTYHFRVVATNGDGTKNGVDRTFTTAQVPAITSVTPNAGLPAGGNTVTITGSGFTNTATVNFGTTPSGSVTFVSATELKAKAPAHASGVVAIAVTTVYGTSAAGNGDLYAYGAPTITSFTPASAKTGTTVTINGTDFVPGVTVKFGTKASPTVTWVSATKITAVVPNGAVAAKISVTSPAGTGTSTSTFTPSFSVTSVSPAKCAPGTVVTIHGLGFNRTTQVRFNGKLASHVTYVSATEIHATVPSGATSGAITVTNSSGATGTVQSDVAYVRA